MSSVCALIRRHPVPIYFVLTFAISWGGVLLAIGGVGEVPGARAENDPRFPIVFLAMLAGPGVAGILLTGVVHGKAALREFLSRLLAWRVSPPWYAAVLLTAPLLAATTLVALSQSSPVFVPAIFASDAKAQLLLFAIAVGLGAGFFEELGWTGFAVPELRLRHGVLATGLVVGLLWGAWHVLVVVWGIGPRAGSLPLPLFVTVDLFSVLPAFRVLMVWIYDRTGSLLVAMLMHASLTASALIFTPSTIGIGMPLLVYDLVLAAAVWIVVAAIGVGSGGQLSRYIIRRRAA